ncbi:hypothetical protein DPMN_038281 [Dreissena polymorpha]|uniref:Uncharacterized protein n=1 Tax=Dreissena polymorpha TaxID=45954 RepID=A0A9D4KGJ5_DREPO|nr:hypothetical protein DPMN_112465 [Dreissena polymorpha]KAH3875022.1 hypothetical protein DPMN_038281 [Dreissena polymorpha]
MIMFVLMMSSDVAPQVSVGLKISCMFTDALHEDIRHAAMVGFCQMAPKDPSYFGMMIGRPRNPLCDLGNSY